MKRILSINLGNYGSTGAIAYGIKEIAGEAGYDVCCAYPGNSENKVAREGDYIICSNLFRRINHRLAYHSGLQGCFALLSTYKLLKKMDAYSPDILHLHNLHGDYINLSMLFSYIKRHSIPVVWTLHDCWTFTARCPHFQLTKCMKWKTGCYACPYPPKSYPEGILDCSKFNWAAKQKCFTGIKKMVLAVPSKWLADLVQDSYLQGYPTKVIHNGIDLSVFKPTESGFRKRHQIENKYLLLGVAFGWSPRKGLDVFIELSKRLDHEKYQIVLVGTDEIVDRELPQNIISIHRTKSQTELAEIYTAANLFVNPTREETLGLVNVEALACGTPVVTFRTGGSPECIDETCGSVVEPDDLDSLQREIERIHEARPYAKESCMRRSIAFDKNDRFQEYVRLYEEMAVQG